MNVDHFSIANCWTSRGNFISGFITDCDADEILCKHADACKYRWRDAWIPFCGIRRTGTVGNGRISVARWPIAVGSGRVGHTDRDILVRPKATGFTNI